jgi:hypothetical protein
MPERVLTDQDVVIAIKDFSPGIVDPKAAGPGAGGGTIVAAGGAQEVGTAGCVANVDGSLGPGFKLTQSYAEPVPAAFNIWDATSRPADAPYRWLAASALIAPAVAQLSGEQEIDNLSTVAIAYAEYIGATAAGTPTAGQPFRESVGWNLWSNAGSSATPLAEFANWQTRMDTNFNHSGGSDIPFRQIYSDLVAGWCFSQSAFTQTVRRSIFWLASTRGYDLQVATNNDWFTWPDVEAVLTQARRNTALGTVHPIGYPGVIAGSCFHQAKLLTTTKATVAATPPVIDISPVLSSFIVQPIAGYIYFNPARYTVDSGLDPAIPYGFTEAIGSEDYNITGLLSMNAETLFITQMVGGCSALRGPIANPQYTPLASVPPTGAYFSRPCRTKIGAVYAAATGIYAWNEGNQVTDLSVNLPGRFWVTKGTAYDKSFMLQRRGKLAASGKWLFVPNDYFLNLDSGAWWRMPAKPDVDTPPYQHYEVTPGDRVYAIPAYQSANTTTLWNQYDMSRPEDAAGATWSWKSHVFPDLLDTRSMVCREVKVIASGAGTVALTVEGGDTSSTATITVSNHPQTYRVDTAVHTINTTRGTTWGTTLSLLATGSGSGPLPTVHSVDLVFSPKQSIPRAN